MPRKRQLDPEFFSDEEIAKLSPLARLFYQGTWCFCEDTAVFKVKFPTLKMQILPYDNVDVSLLYEEIFKEQFYVQFKNGSDTYAFIKGFHKRQIIQHPSRSILPLPPEPFLSKIPEKIKRLNECSLSPQLTLIEEYDRVELSRVELSRDKKEPEPSAVLKEKLGQVYKNGLNIYALITKFWKQARLTEPLPEPVLLAVCEQYFKQKQFIRNEWPWFIKVLKAESEKFFANRNIQEHQEFQRLGMIALSDLAQQVSSKLTVGGRV